MRLSKIVGTLVATFAFVAAITITTESRAGDEELVSVSCTAGSVTVTGKNGWHTNEKAPWRWDKGDLVKEQLTKTSAVFKGAKCEGTIKAYICLQDQCKGPIPVQVH